MKTAPAPKKHQPKAPTCALEGCNKRLHVASTGRPGKYCCDLHRAMAGKQRAKAAKTATPPPPAYNRAQRAAGGAIVVAANDRDSARPPRGQAVGISDTRAAAHQVGKGSSTVRYTSVLHLHVHEETIEEVQE